MNIQYPRISIVTPNLNQAKFLEQTILSITNQGYPNLEYIIIDGGSTDGSIEIIKKHEKQLAFWISESDNGMYDAIQKGFDKSTGEIMAWINSDDMYQPKSFFTIAEIFTAMKDVNWLLGTATIYDKTGRTLSTESSFPFTKYDFYSKEFFWIQQESCFWRRSLWLMAGAKVNTTLKMAGDFDLWLRFFRSDKLYVVDALIGGIRVRGDGQLSQNFMDKYFEEAYSALSNEPISETDRKVLNKYKFLKKICRRLSRYKFINSEYLISNFRKKYFRPAPRIKYDFVKLYFYLE